jgi:hypothetical protein
MKIRSSTKWLVACAVVGAAAAAAGGALLATTRPGSASAQPTGASGNISPLVDQFAQQAGVLNLRTLASAGRGKAAIAIITGTDRHGLPCWTVTAVEGHQGAPFRCGSTPAPEKGSLWVFYGVGGAAGSSTAGYASLVGLVTPNVARVQADMVDGSTRELPLTEGAFAYASSSADNLPTSIRAFDDSGRLVGEKDIILAG